MHTLIIGQTATGKTTLAKQLAVSYLDAGKPVLVCDPVGDTFWREIGCDYVTPDMSAFSRAWVRCKSCLCIVDEAGEAIGRDNSYIHCATRSRHYGHRFIFITQRAATLQRTVRDQCIEIIAFRLSPQDAKDFARDYHTAFAHASGLEIGAFLRYKNGIMEKGRVF